ncbi:hypothetical protein Erwinia_phage_Pastis_00073 [Erwinia phage Pastis]|nr:hypothetical protein Erwinia_phage_Pastis_00073 [Erwinia phage Pastis]
MTLIELLARRQKMNGDTFGKTLFGLYFHTCLDDELPARRYALRKFLGGLHAAYLHSAS